jgi:putative methionine-R-sulfoxide reductase with GAF domain
MKGVVNDYKSTLSLLAKINKLVEVQHIFCERVMMTDIFERICEIVCQTLECDRTTLYLVDNAKKELWSKAAKDSKAIIKLPFGKGLAGYVAESKSNLVLDDAYFDPRFNKEYDLKTGYKTKSVLCVPIFDKDSKVVIGVIQSLNKKPKPHVFDVNDEITSELLSRMVGSQLKHSIEFSDYMVHENKLKKLLTSGHEFFLTDSLLNLVYNYKKLIKHMFSSEKVQVLINLRDFEFDYSKYKDLPEINQKCYFKISDKTFYPLKDERVKLGIVGCVLDKPQFTFVQSTYNNHLYNPTIDIDTSLPVITMPILHPELKHILGVVQYEHNVARLTISDFRINQVDQIDFNMIQLLTRMFGLNLMKFMVGLKNSVK